jgi:uncharacterized RDD family membrane protein YckC
VETACSSEIETPQGSLRIARIGDRVLAAIIDTIALLPIYFLAGSCIGVWFDSYHDGTFKLTGGPALLFFLVIAVIWIVYYVVGESSFRGTIGKHVAGIEVGSMGSLSLTFSQVFTRNILRPIDAIGLYLVGFLVALSSKQDQRIGDKVAGTIVYEKDVTNRARAVFLWIAFVVGGLILNAVFRHFAVPINQ